MKTRTYYKVELEPNKFYCEDCHPNCEGSQLTLARARRVFRYSHKKQEASQGFPRVIKVVTQMKIITNI